MDASQCRAARALLNWSQGELAKRAKVSEKALWDLEAERRDPRPETIEKISHALEHAGVEFIAEDESSAGGGAGVRLAKPKRKKSR
jgi:transcriptional regulator with XRE-family HTH domain